MVWKYKSFCTFVLKACSLWVTLAMVKYVNRIEVMKEITDEEKRNRKRNRRSHLHSLT